MSWPGPPAVSQHSSRTPRARAGCLPRAPALTHALAVLPAGLLPPTPRALLAHQRAQRRVATQLPILRHRQPCLLPLHLTIQFLYCDTNSLQPSLMQYKFAIQSFLEPATFQPPRLQYKLSIAIQSTSHNTIWAVALPNFCTKKNFIINILFFPLFPAVENH